MKTAGFLLIILSFSFFGILLGRRISEKLSDMKKSEEIITVLINGTQNGRHTLEELLEDISKICGRELAEKLLFFAQNEKNCANDSFFFGNEKALQKAISVFGTCFAKEQVSELEYYREAVRKEIADNEEAYRKNAKLFGSLGVLAGFMAAILLY